MINKDSSLALDIRFKPLIKLAGELLTETQNTAFEVGYHQGIDDLVTYLQKKGFSLPDQIKGVKGRLVAQIITSELK